MEPTEGARPLLPYLAVLAAVGAAIFVRAGLEGTPAPPTAIAGYLERELGARVGAIVEWERARREALESIADDPSLRRELGVALAGGWAPLDARLGTACAELEGCALVRPDGTVLASYAGRDLPEGLVAHAARGRTVQSKLVATGAHGRLDPAPGSERYAVFFATPIVVRGEVRAVLTGRVHPDEELGPILGQRPLGRTGETYAVDPRGYMVTRSRWDAQGRQPMSAPRVLGAPATWLRTPSDTPTRALASLHGSRADVDGYLDYRGVRVVGAWRWMDELGAGVITEMDASEAYRTTTVR